VDEGTQYLLPYRRTEMLALCQFWRLIYMLQPLRQQKDDFDGDSSSKTPLTADRLLHMDVLYI
jgi:hypothetical protein